MFFLSVGDGHPRALIIATDKGVRNVPADLPPRARANHGFAQAAHAGCASCCRRALPFVGERDNEVWRCALAALMAAEIYLTDF